LQSITQETGILQAEADALEAQQSAQEALITHYQTLEHMLTALQGEIEALDHPQETVRKRQVIA
jgi:hypothetical protein